jgi:hypothetical protein
VLVCQHERYIRYRFCLHGLPFCLLHTACLFLTCILNGHYA